MLEKKIRLRAVDEVCEFVRAAERCEFEVDILNDELSVIDAKSIIGVFSIDLNRPLTVQYCIQDGELEHVLNKYEVV